MSLQKKNPVPSIVLLSVEVEEQYGNGTLDSYAGFVYFYFAAKYIEKYISLYKLSKLNLYKLIYILLL